jgi:hypothetical protein
MQKGARACTVDSSLKVLRRLQRLMDPPRSTAATAPRLGPSAGPLRVRVVAVPAQQEEVRLMVTAAQMSWQHLQRTYSCLRNAPSGSSLPLMDLQQPMLQPASSSA